MARTLEGTSWVLDPDASDIAGAHDFIQTAEFNDGRMAGSSGCNRYTASFTKNRSKLTLGPVAGTKRGCPPPAAEVENEFLARLERVAAYRIKGDRLTLVDSDGEPVLAFVVLAATLEGSWEITGYLMASGAGFSSTVIDSAPSAVFGADGSISGATGCNSYRGTYTVDGVAISIGPLRTTRMGCPPDRAEQEAGILKAMEAAATFTLAPGTATLQNVSGQLVLSLAAG